MAQLFLFRRGYLVVVGRAKVGRRVRISRKGSYSSDQSPLVFVWRNWFAQPFSMVLWRDGSCGC